MNRSIYRGYGDERIPPSGRVTDVDLTSETLDVDDGTQGSPSRPKGRVESGGVTTIFSDLEAEAIAFIEGSSIIVGCVAWLTNFPILTALSRRNWVAMVVQKEDFLRPDLGATAGHGARLRSAYASLPHYDSRYMLPGQVAMMSSHCDPTLDAVRCVGVANTQKLSAVPRMHHKFMVRVEELITRTPHTLAEEQRRESDTRRHYAEFPQLRGRSVEAALADRQYWEDQELSYNYVPTAVWTGSYNLTYNGGRSLENALILTDPDICAAYLAEWSFIEALSEPLDWETPWMAPEWRIGT